MRSLFLVLTCLWMLLAIGCGPEYVGDMHAAGYEYSFVIGVPYEFNGADAADDELVQAARELLQGRTVEPHDLSIITDPEFKDNSVIQSGRIYSHEAYEVSTGENILIARHEKIYRGELGITGGVATVVLDTDQMGEKTPVRLELTFNLAAAQDLVDSLKDWRADPDHKYTYSQETLPVEVILSGVADGYDWVLRCMADLTGVSIFWFAS